MYLLIVSSLQVAVSTKRIATMELFLTDQGFTHLKHKIRNKFIWILNTFFETIDIDFTIYEGV
jgi:hypothetical protein